MNGQRSASWAALTLLAALNAGCMASPRPPLTLANEVPPNCEFPADVRLAFAERTTLGEVGLAHDEGMAALPARVWITAEPIRFERPGLPDLMTRVICAQWGAGQMIRAPFPPVRQGG